MEVQFNRPPGKASGSVGNQLRGAHPEGVLPNSHPFPVPEGHLRIAQGFQPWEPVPPSHFSPEGVKKLKTAKIPVCKSLITNGCILRFWTFRRFFHTFEGTAEAPDSVSAPCPFLLRSNLNRGTGDLTSAAYSVDLARGSPLHRDNLWSAYAASPQALNESPETYVVACFTLPQQSPKNTLDHFAKCRPWSTKQFSPYLT